MRMADDRDRETIYHIRHEVYAAELAQHSTNTAGRLTDSLDAFNHYIVVSDGDRIVGFVSITPPGGPGYSIDKYFKREQLPFPVDDNSTRSACSRCRKPPAQLWPRRSCMPPFAIEARGGTRSWHRTQGNPQDPSSGRTEAHRPGCAVWRRHLWPAAWNHGRHPRRPSRRRPILDRVQTEISWRIGVAYDTPAACYHGGKFFEAVGDEFQTLERLDSVINADVLDAWFPPSPKAVAAIEQHLPQILRTSPPTGCEGLIRTIARVRGVRPECILPGAGSSDLIFLALRHWLTRLRGC